MARPAQSAFDGTTKALTPEAEAVGAGPAARAGVQLDLVEAARAIRREVEALRKPERLRRKLVEFFERKACEIIKFGERCDGLAWGDRTEAVEALGRFFVASDPELVSEYPSLSGRPTRGAIYRTIAEVSKGNYAAVLSGIRPRPRGSRRLAADLQARYRAQLTHWLVGGQWHRPTEALVDDLSEFAAANGLPEATRCWARNAVSELRGDAVISARARYGSRWKWHLSHAFRDWSKEYPGSMLVGDCRTADVTCIDRSGRPVRPTIIRFDDGYTGVPVSVSVLATAANADSIMLALVDAFLPKPVDSPLTRHLDLGMICGIPRVIYLDNGKEFSGERMDGVHIDGCGKRRVMTRRVKKDLARQAMEEASRSIEALCLSPELEGAYVHLGLPGELGSQIIRANPYNGRAKTVERSFGDDSRRFDTTGIGHRGNNPVAKTDNARELEKEAERLWKSGLSPAEIAKRTGLPTIDDFSEQYMAHLYKWSQRESSSERLRRDGRQWSPLAFYQRYAPANRVIPSKELLQRLFTRRITLKVKGCYVAWTRARGEVKTRYRSTDLMALGGKEVIVEYSPLDDSWINVIGVVGYRNDDAVYGIGPGFRCAKYDGPAAVADREEIAVEMKRQGDEGRAATAHLQGLTDGAVDFNPMVEYTARIKKQNEGKATASRRGDIVYTTLRPVSEPRPAVASFEEEESATPESRRLVLWDSETA